MSAAHLPRITVVTPAYRARHLITTTLDSVLNQNYPNLEYIVLDGAGDDTAEVLERYSPRLAYWRSAPDEGQYAAITEGFARATGDILFWLNADDMLLPGALHVVGQVFAAFPQVSWLSTLRPGLYDAAGHLALVDRLPGFARTAFLDGRYLPGQRRKGNWIQAESTFFRRDLWERAGGRFPDYPLAGDFALWCAFYRHAELVGIDYPLGGFRVIEGQRSQAIEQYTAEAQQALDSLRGDVGYRPSPPLRSLGYAKLAEVPGFRRLIHRLGGYQGQIVTNAELRNATPQWTLAEHTFLP